MVVSQDGRNRRWVFRYSKPSTGKPTELGLGKAELFTLEAARDKALEHRKAVARGHDPVELKREAKPEGTTFGEVVDAFIPAKAPGWGARNMLTRCDTCSPIMRDYWRRGV